MSNGPEWQKKEQTRPYGTFFCGPGAGRGSLRTAVQQGNADGGCVRVRKKGLSPKRKPLNLLERETGFEPATSTLARLHSTTELLPLNERGFYARDPLSVKQLFLFCRKIKNLFPNMLLLLSLFCGSLVDDTLGLALGALDGMRFHEAHLGGDAQEFLDALLDGAF